MKTAEVWNAVLGPVVQSQIQLIQDERMAVGMTLRPKKLPLKNTRNQKTYLNAWLLEMAFQDY